MDYRASSVLIWWYLIQGKIHLQAWNLLASLEVCTRKCTNWSPSGFSTDCGASFPALPLSPLFNRWFCSPLKILQLVSLQKVACGIPPPTSSTPNNCLQIIIPIVRSIAQLVGQSCGWWWCSTVRFPKGMLFVWHAHPVPRTVWTVK